MWILIPVMRTITELMIFLIFLRYSRSNVVFKDSEHHFRYFIIVLIVVFKVSHYTIYYDIISYPLYYLYLVLFSKENFFKASWLYIKFVIGILLSFMLIQLCFTYLFDWPILDSNILYRHTKDMIIYLLIYIFLSLFITPANKKGHSTMTSSKKILLALFLISTGLLCFAAYLYNPKASSVNTSLLVFLLIVLSILIFALILCLSSRFLEQEEQRHLLEQRLQKQEMDLAYYEDVSDALLQVSRLRHDFKNHLIIISDYIERKEPELALHYIQRISDLSHVAVEEVFTNNSTVSAVLNIKRQECRKQNIPFHMQLSFPRIYQLEDIHIVAILGNMLDNAITATSKLAESKRDICLAIRQMDTYLDIVCQNTFDGTLHFGKNGELLTTKHASHRHHGLGIPNMRDAVEQYGGEFDLTYDDSTFIIHILVPNHD